VVPIGQDEGRSERLRLCAVPRVEPAHRLSPAKEVLEMTHSICACAAAIASFATLASAQFTGEKVELLSRVAIDEFAGFQSGGNDCWGYTSPSGREYAIMGLHSGVGFVEITEPRNPVILETILHGSSITGDMKVIGEYCYAVNESGSDGMQVIDMTRIDEGIVKVLTTFTGGGFRTAHNIAANPASEHVYFAVPNIAFSALMAVDVSDPANPVIAGQWSGFVGHVHDAQVVTFTDGPYAGREIAFCFSGWDTTFDIIDVTDKSNMTRIGSLDYPDGSYTHQGWVHDLDNRYLYIDDELDEIEFKADTTRTIVVDISDLTNPTYAGSFTTGRRSTDHNLYVRDGFVYEANYTTGLHVFDASDPLAPVQVGWFDTYPPNDDVGYGSGAWSVFPYFPSGVVIVSDTDYGLFVLDVSEAVGAGCRADLTGDGVLDFFDFLEFQNLFAAGDPRADFDDNGLLDFFDFLAFQDEFAAGCP
jgi:choice-of-anchor B domain-containing protein